MITAQDIQAVADALRSDVQRRDGKIAGLLAEVDQLVAANEADLVCASIADDLAERAAADPELTAGRGNGDMAVTLWIAEIYRDGLAAPAGAGAGR